jgi:hypothetical protein
MDVICRWMSVIHFQSLKFLMLIFSCEKVCRLSVSYLTSVAFFILF